MMVAEVVTFLTHILAETSEKRLEVPLPLVAGFPQSADLSNKSWTQIILTADLKNLCVEVIGYFKNSMRSRPLLNHAQLYHLASSQIELSEKHGAEILVSNDPRYPESLRALRDHPHTIFVLGSTELLRRRKMAVIGSRRANQHAVMQSFIAGGILAELGFAVCSGGAFGCDIAAHEGVLARSKASPIPAICVFASGLQTFYPKTNALVFEAIRERGGLFVSEKLWGEVCLPKNFPTRNRIICGLSESVFLMQAAEKSGSMVSARIAAQEGRDIFVLTHEQDDVTAAGGLRLIEEGATPFDHFEEIVHAFC